MSECKVFAVVYGVFCLGMACGGALVGLRRKKGYSETDLLIAHTNGFLKGHLTGDKEFANYYKEHDPEGYAKIMES